jgi:hypothetical protein
MLEVFDNSCCLLRDFPTRFAQQNEIPEAGRFRQGRYYAATARFGQLPQNRVPVCC